MAITIDDFAKVWASQSPLTPYEFSESQYKEGWNFIGGTPPARQMWDFLQKNNDEKMQYLADNYLPLSGGTMTGAISTNTGEFIKRNADNGYIRFMGGTSSSNGSFVALFGKDHSTQAGEFLIRAKDSSSQKDLVGKPDGTLTWNSQPLLPVGVVQAFAGSTTPNGWLLCDGSAVSREAYANLFAVIGTSYGAGDGSATFNLPNLTDKFIQGNATSGTEHSAGLPNITGSFIKLSQASDGAQQALGAFAWEGWHQSVVGDAASDLGGNISFDASRSSSIYGASNTVQPPSVTMRYIIKY